MIAADCGDIPAGNALQSTTMGAGDRGAFGEIKLHELTSLATR